MGICLDTESNTAAREETSEWKEGSGMQRSAHLRTPIGGSMPMQNAGKVKFDPPKVPVIFVLGGPGSGKVTHCDTLMQEKRGITHINMMDLLQQYAIGNDMQDFSQLSSKTVTEVLMLEMKMAPAAKAYLISGYPRSMRDVVEYSEKIQVISGVILISWRENILQKQIDYGAKLGHVVLSLAKMELKNFFENVKPVGDYYDQSDMLIAVNGERAPAEVYKDFRAAVLEILSAQENKEAMLNGIAGMGRGVNDIPGSIVSVDTAPSQHKNSKTSTPSTNEIDINMNYSNQLMGQNVGVIATNDTNVTHEITQNLTQTSAKDLPPIIWVIGGPGSNKSTLCLKVKGLNPGWEHISIGRLLRSIAESDPKANTEEYTVKEAISTGDMVSKKIVKNLLMSRLLQNSNKKGIIIDGYPRDMEQVNDFEDRQKPPIILLDCSKLQLGRGRIDDTVSSFRKRLELFRELTLPMLKQMDSNGRLTIIDGDTDSPSVQREFEKVMRNKMQEMVTRRQTLRETNPGDMNVVDLENMPGSVPTISGHISLMNGNLNKPKNQQPNGDTKSFRHLLQESENTRIDSYM